MVREDLQELKSRQKKIKEELQNVHEKRRTETPMK